MALQTATMTGGVTIAGLLFTPNVSVSGEGTLAHTLALPAGVAGVRGATTGLINSLPTGHGFENDENVDVHWTDPATGAHMVARGALVSGAGANAITVTAIIGDALPVTGVPVIVSVQTIVGPSGCTFAGSYVVAMGFQADQAAFVAPSGVGNSGGEALPVYLDGKAGWTYLSGQFTNPLAGNAVTNFICSNGSTTPANVRIGILLTT